MKILTRDSSIINRVFSIFFMTLVFPVLTSITLNNHAHAQMSQDEARLNAMIEKRRDEINKQNREAIDRERYKLETGNYPSSEPPGMLKFIAGMFKMLFGFALGSFGSMIPIFFTAWLADKIMGRAKVAAAASGFFITTFYMYYVSEFGYWSFDFGIFIGALLVAALAFASENGSWVKKAS